MGARWTREHAQYLGECIRHEGGFGPARVTFSRALGIDCITESAGRNLLLRYGLPSASKWVPGRVIPPPPPTSQANEVADRFHVDKEPEPAAIEPRVSRDLERILVVPDCHHPYVDKRAWSALLAAGRSFKPHRIVVLGDFCDHYCTSRHLKDPNRPALLEYEVNAANAALDELDALGAEYKHFLQGNHEENLERLLQEKAPALFNIVRTEQLFRLAERGWTYTPYRQHLKVGKCYYVHDTGASGQTAHIKSMQAFSGCVVQGHTHQAAAHYSGSAVGHGWVGIMAGWVGDASKAEYAHDIQKKRTWQHSFVVGVMLPDGVTHFQLVPIIDGCAWVGGEMVAA